MACLLMLNMNPLLNCLVAKAHVLMTLFRVIVTYFYSNYGGRVICFVGVFRNWSTFCWPPA